MRYKCLQIKTNLLATYNPTQLQPNRGHPFLVSPCVIPCYKIIPIKNYVRAKDDFFRIKQIARNSYKDILDNSQLIDEFERLCKGFTFVDSWDDPEITSETFQINARNVPGKYSSCDFFYSVERLHSNIHINQNKFIYLQRCMYYILE